MTGYQIWFLMMVVFVTGFVCGLYLSETSNDRRNKK
jgi:hypothetical protein